VWVLVFEMTYIVLEILKRAQAVGSLTFVDRWVDGVHLRLGFIWLFMGDGMDTMISRFEVMVDIRDQWTKLWLFGVTFNDGASKIFAITLA
jgi:hypothetical protein